MSILACVLAAIGFAGLAYGTSAPEIGASLVAVLRGSPGMAVGNVIGSNPVLHTWDVSFGKRTMILRDVHLNLRFEMLNLFNSPNWCGPRSVIGASNFGQIQCTSGFPRTLQFMTKITF